MTREESKALSLALASGCHHQPDIHGHSGPVAGSGYVVLSLRQLVRLMKSLGPKCLEETDMEYIHRIIAEEETV
jgi:hypothetical protein